ncbi:MAG TPA: hypothetical protein VNB23_08815 [Ramlibacter sp.]|nr:hypothetical protein [Ramlibacter sp.]
MHTAICTFENHAEADRAVERLLQSGFDRHNVHLEHRHADGSPVQGYEEGSTGAAGSGQEPLMQGEPASAGQANDNWDGQEREVAMDPKLVRRLGNFFERLFGHDEGAQDRVTSYSSAVDRGHCVVIVEAGSDEEAERAQSILHGMNPADVSLFQRVGQRPLRELIAEHSLGTSQMEQRFGTARADMAPSHNMDVRGEGEFPRERERQGEGERATASQGWGEQRKLELVDDDQPIASPDLRHRDMPDDKPR